MFGEKKIKLYLSHEQYRVLMQSLVKLKNALLQQERHTDCVDELILKLMEAPVKKVKV